MVKIFFFLIVGWRGVACALSMFSVSAFAGGVTGVTASGLSFEVQTEVVPARQNQNGIWGILKITYKSKINPAGMEYVFPVQAPPVIRKNQLNLIVISEKIGGMNGRYRVVFFAPSDADLFFVGGLELSEDLGRFVEYTDLRVPSMRPVGEDGLVDIVSAYFINKDLLLSADGELSFDNALLFLFAGGVVDLRRVVGESALYSVVERINDSVDSSVSNLFRKNLIGGGVSLCLENQYDVFVCRSAERVISVCATGYADQGVFNYVYGSAGKVELSLAVERGSGENNFVFRNGVYEYIVEMTNPDWKGVVVKKNGALVARKECSRVGLEPYLLPVK